MAQAIRMTTGDFTMPIIHLNGTSASQLFEDAERCAQAVRLTSEMVRQLGPNQRDYYASPDPDLWAKARTAHMRRIGELQDMIDYYEAVMVLCSEAMAR